MAENTFDASGWKAGLDRLQGPLRESLARRMAVSGGVILRDEAKVRAPRSDGPYTPYSGEGSRHSEASGTLADSIYLAFDQNKSTQTLFTYRITWNDEKAWWGRLIEFGHWRPFGVGLNKEGFYVSHNPTKRKGKKGEGDWVSAKPFLGPTFDAKLTEARTAMIERGRNELPKLLRGS